jgi:hypothetical protein
VKKEPDKTRLLVIAVIVNVIVLSLLVGLSLIVIRVFFQGKIDRTLIPIFGMVFFIGSVITTGFVYRIYMRRLLGKERLQEILDLRDKEKGPGRKT